MTVDSRWMLKLFCTTLRHMYHSSECDTDRYLKEPCLQFDIVLSDLLCSQLPVVPWLVSGLPNLFLSVLFH